MCFKEQCNFLPIWAQLLYYRQLVVYTLTIGLVLCFPVSCSWHSDLPCGKKLGLQVGGEFPPISGEKQAGSLWKYTECMV